MERLTWKRDLDGYTDVGLRDGVSVGDAICQLAEYEDAIPFDRAQELAQDEKDGRLVVLPCKIWDLYFTIERFCDENGELPEFTLHSASDCEWCCVPCNKRLDIIEHRFSNAKHILSLNDSIGKSVFLTREAAEAALKKREEADDETD